VSSILRGRWLESRADAVAGRLRRRAQRGGARMPISFRVTPLTLDAALRYSAVADLMAERFRPGVQILEVGSGAAGITSFLDYPVTGVDTAFERTAGWETPYLLRVEASADALPFDDESFDFVLSLEMLEHIPAGGRETVLRELFRVLRPGGRMIVTFPADETAARLDRELNEAFRARYGFDHPWVSEHITEGVPRTEAVVHLAEAVAGDRAGVSFRKHDPARSWRIHQMLYSAHRAYLAAFAAGLHTRAGATLLFHLLRRVRGREHYRTILLVDRVP
jgi:ubiquinone/menaquinone biosynthesis C-methylase UbiE